MIDLDETTRFSSIDTSNMMAEINDLPGQLEKAWALGMDFTLPALDGITQIIVSGMGGSAIGADLLAAYVEPLSRVPVTVQRDYTLPAWAKGPGTLLVASSHSGNTEETLSVFQQARQAGCRCVIVSTGGKLSQLAREQGLPLWTFEHKGQPRSAVGYSFGLLLALFTRLGFIPDPMLEVTDAIQEMRLQQAQLQIDVPVTQNPAKRQAGQLIDRWVAVFGSGIMAPVARRWKGQLSEVAKAWAQFEALPEADHNTLAGTEFPESLLGKTCALFLRAPSDHPRNTLRSELTMRGFMLAGMGTDFYMAKGKTRLAQLWTALHFGDFMAYYLAMLYEVDPTPIPAIEDLKQAMKA